MVDEVESKLSGVQNGSRPKGCGRGRLANVAPCEEIAIVAFNLPNAVRVRQPCLTAVTITAMAYPRSHLMPGACLAYFQIFEFGRADYVFVVRGLGYFCDSGWSLVA